MGWRGTLRSIGAAARAAERDARRRQKELEREAKQYEKMLELERAEHDVEVYENHIAVIQSLHAEQSVPLNWHEIVNSAPPEKPENLGLLEQDAIFAAEQYRPGILDRIFRTEAKKRRNLEHATAEAKWEDDREFQEMLRLWEEETSNHAEQVEIGKRLLAGDQDAKLEIIREVNPFEEVATLGSSIGFSIGESGVLEATIQVHGNEIVPAESKSLLKSGKLSVKKMPKGRFFEIYQDYVSSCILRVSLELFALIRDDFVIVTAADDLLNPATGHMEQAAILSALISRKTLDSLDMKYIDPSDSMNNFVHNTSFRKTKGFEPVARIDASKLNLDTYR